MTGSTDQPWGCLALQGCTSFKEPNNCSISGAGHTGISVALGPVVGEAEAKGQYHRNGQAARVDKDFDYQTRETWSRARRVIGKAEYLSKGENPRFIVTSLAHSDYPARSLYEEHYWACGDRENRIKEQHSTCSRARQGARSRGGVASLDRGGGTRRKEMVPLARFECTTFRLGGR